MLSERLKVSNGTRIISREPSPIIRGLERLEPELFEEERGQLCQYTPINILGSMLVERNSNWNMRAPLLKSNDLERFAGGPIEYMTDIPVAIFDDDSREYRSIGIMAREVLFKRSCGLPAAVVLTGDMAGLLLSARTDKDPWYGMCIERVWNDNPLSTINLPYSPNHLFDDLGLKEYEKYTVGFEGIMAKSDRLRKKLVAIYDANYVLAVRQLEKRLGRIPTEVDMFFYLCKKMRIPVDIEAFHYTSKAGVTS